MNKTVQNQLVNLSTVLFHRKDSKSRAFEQIPKPEVLVIDLSAFEPIFVKKQYFKMELLKFNFDTHPIMNSFQFGEGLEIPETRDLFSASNLFQQTRVKGTQAESVKNEFYNASGECHQCGSVVSRKFKNHTLSHLKNSISLEDIDSSAEIKKFLKTKTNKKVHHQRLVKKAQRVKLGPRTFDELEIDDDDGEELEKKYGPEIAV